MPTLPNSRTYLYSEYRSCERFGLVPPGVLAEWDSNPKWVQLLLVAYNDIRCQEEAEAAAAGVRL